MLHPSRGDYAVSNQNQNRVQRDEGFRVRGDSSKIQIVRLPFGETALSAFREAAYGNENGDQCGTASLRAADALITNIIL